MDQSMIMIPMYSKKNGAHCAIARIRISQGRASVEIRQGGISHDEELFLLTANGVHAVRDGRAQLNGETICGIASIDDRGTCRCFGVVRGHEASFERMLVRLRMERQSDKRNAIPARGIEPMAKSASASVKQGQASEAEAMPTIKITQAPSQKENAPQIQVRQMDGYKSRASDIPVTAQRDSDGDAVLCSRAMDGYVSAANQGEAVEVFATKKESAAQGLIKGYASDAEFLAAHPNISGEEPGFSAWNAKREKESEDAAEVMSHTVAPIKQQEEWAMDAPSAQLPEFQETQRNPSAQETVFDDDNPGTPLPERAMPYPTVMPYRVDNPFPKQFPGSSWVKIQRLQGQGYYLEGNMRRGAEIITITAAPGEYSPVPPRHLQGFTRYIQTKEGGFWVRIRRE